MYSITDWSCCKIVRIGIKMCTRENDFDSRVSNFWWSRKYCLRGSVLQSNSFWDNVFGWSFLLTSGIRKECRWVDSLYQAWWVLSVTAWTIETKGCSSSERKNSNRVARGFHLLEKSCMIEKYSSPTRARERF